ncbi:MAG: LPS-assembly protein LptD, partial [Candidatus Rokubacteria bacterium]|nr:LPS-assembly protein LptD [Candidatus Rokubacteria bacterium]
MATRTRTALLAVGLWLLATATAGAQAPPVTVTTPDGEVTVIADEIEEIGPEGLVIATGDVEITRGDARLTADRVEMNRETGDTVATGHVVFHDGEDRITADRVDYNFRTGTGVLHRGHARAAPYYRLSGEKLERVDDKVYRVRNGVFTTCEADPPPWSFKMGSATADLESFVWGRNASFWVKRLPLIPWIPFFAAPIRRERQTGFLFPSFGTSTDKGFAAHLPFFWAISDSQDATIGLQLYERRGAGVTGEYRYVLRALNEGSVKGFFLRETEGRGADEDQLGQPRADTIDRAWGRVRHDWAIAPGLSLKADVRGVSDDLVLREYGDTLAQRSEQRVESLVFVTRNWASWSGVASAFGYQDLTTPRPIELNRLPELSLRSVRQPVPGLPGVLWELDTSAVRFVRDLGSDGSRVDVHPRLSRPVSLAGLATFTPFVGGRLTGYDRRVTRLRVTREGQVVEQTTDDLQVRQLIEVGGDVESSLSRPYRLGGWQGLEAVRHSVEPRVNYTLIDGRAMDRLPSWTDLDRIQNTSRVEYSLTNRLRARTVAPEGGEPRRYELARLVVGHAFDLREDRKQSGDVFADLLVQSDRLAFRGDVRHDTHGRGVQTANADVTLTLARLTASAGTTFSDPARITFLRGGLNVDVLP